MTADPAAQSAHPEGQWHRPQTPARRRLPAPAELRLNDRDQLFGKTECTQPDTVTAEGITFNHFRAGFDVFLVDFLHHLRRGKVQLIEAAVDENAFGIEHGAHSAVGHYNFRLQLAAEFSGAGK